MGLRSVVVNDDELRLPHNDQNAGAILKRTLVGLLEQGERSGVSTRTILDILAAVKVGGKPSVYYPLPSGDPKRFN